MKQLQGRGCGRSDAVAFEDKVEVASGVAVMVTVGTAVVPTAAADAWRKGPQGARAAGQRKVLHSAGAGHGVGVVECVSVSVCESVNAPFVVYQNTIGSSVGDVCHNSSSQWFYLGC